MNTFPNPTPTNDYFADIGFWLKGTGVHHYVIGLILALVLTIIPFALLEIHLTSKHETFTHPFLMLVAVVCALLQFLVQVAFFLHLVGRGAPRERLAIFSGACLVVAILVGGSLWIMTDLSARMTAPPSDSQMEFYMQDQGGF